MPKSKTPRKAHGQRLVRIPVTRALADEFGMSMHCSLAVLEAQPSEDAFESLAGCLNVISLALTKKALLAREHMPVIQSGALALQAIGARADRSGIWHASELELMPLRRAVCAAEGVLSALTVTDLYVSMHTVRRLQSIERAQ